MVVDPGDALINDGFCASLTGSEFVAAFPVVIVVVQVKTLVEPEAGIQRIGSDDGAGSKPEFLEMFGKRQGSILDDEVEIVVDSMGEGRCSQQDVDVGGQGRRGMGEGLGEQHAFRSELVDVGGH